MYTNLRKKWHSAFIPKENKMRFSDISIRWKILLLTLGGPITIALIMAWQWIDGIRVEAEKTVVDKSKAIVLMAEATRNEMSRKLSLGVMKPFDQIEPDKLLEAVPVVTAMHTAAINAEKSNYTFRVPKISPRNPKNEPTPQELEVLREIEAKNLEDKILITRDEIRYFKPIKLTQECLFCHGDPKGKTDPTGGTLEGWKVGETHGAFEIISSMAEVNREVRNTALKVFMWTEEAVTNISLVSEATEGLDLPIIILQLTQCSMRLLSAGFNFAIRRGIHFGEKLPSPLV